MLAQPVSDFLSNSAALCDAVLRLRGNALTEELGRIVRAVMNSPLGEYVPADSFSLLPPPVEPVQAANDDGAQPEPGHPLRRPLLRPLHRVRPRPVQRARSAAPGQPGQPGGQRAAVHRWRSAPPTPMCR
jgi:hypothetical protein